jgi:hypothetical protein
VAGTPNAAAAYALARPALPPDAATTPHHQPPPFPAGRQALEAFREDPVLTVVWPRRTDPGVRDGSAFLAPSSSTVEIRVTAGVPA